MITYTPSYIVADHCGHCVFEARQPLDMLPLYEHLARKVLEWNVPREILIDTSGRGCQEFSAIGSQKAARQILAKLFLMAGHGGPRGDFLSRIGIKKWSDLSRPVRVPGRQTSANIEYDVYERQLTEHGPNDCHPSAIYAQSAYLLFGSGLRWHFVLSYGYSHDSSRWYTGVAQQKESLNMFLAETVPAYLDTRLEPEAWDSPRRERNCRWAQLREAVDVLWGWESYSDEHVSTEALVEFLLGEPKPRLTRDRLNEIRKWMRADAAAEKRRATKERRRAQA